MGSINATWLMERCVPVYVCEVYWGLGQGGARAGLRRRVAARCSGWGGITLSLLSRKTGVYLGAARYGTGRRIKVISRFLLFYYSARGAACVSVQQQQQQPPRGFDFQISRRVSRSAGYLSAAARRQRADPEK